MSQETSSPPTIQPVGASISEYAFDSSQQKKAPQLSHRGLSMMLAVMCLIPIGTIATLWTFLPPVHEGQLEANVLAENLPGRDFYSVDYYKRPAFDDGVLVLQNTSDQDWTHVEVRVNKNYQIYDRDPILAHQERRYDLNRFLNRTGARFSLRYNELNHVRLYARRPTKDRATFYQDFPTHFPASSNYWPSIILLGAFAVLAIIAVVLFTRIASAAKKTSRQPVGEA